MCTDAALPTYVLVTGKHVVGSVPSHMSCVVGTGGLSSCRACGLLSVGVPLTTRASLSSYQGLNIFGIYRPNKESNPNCVWSPYWICGNRDSRIYRLGMKTS